MHESPRPFSSPYPADGVTFGRYRDLETIAEGGMGKVYKAFDPQLNLELAIKILPRGLHVSAENVKRFRREVQILAAINHPGVVRVYDSGETEGWHYFTMELIRGLTLLDYINERMPPPECRLRFVSDLAEVLAVLHERDIVHRDLKPSNVMITDDGRLKLTDFGIAKSMGSAQYTEITTFDARPGTPYYMSPDRTNELRDTTTAKKADVYSMAVLAYEILARRLPYDVENLTATECLVVIREEPPTSLSDRGIAINPDVETVIMSGLSKDHSKRPTAAEFAGNLRTALGLTPVVHHKKRSLLPLGIAASIAFALLAGLHIYLKNQHKIELALLQQGKPRKPSLVTQTKGAAGTNAGELDGAGAVIVPEKVGGMGQFTQGEVKKAPENPGKLPTATPEKKETKPSPERPEPIKPPEPKVTEVDKPIKKKVIPAGPSPEDIYLQNVAMGERHIRLKEWQKAANAFKRALEVPGYADDSTARDGLRSAKVKLELGEASKAAGDGDWPRVLDHAQDALTIKTKQNEDALHNAPILRVNVKAAGKPLPTAVLYIDGVRVRKGFREVKVKPGVRYRIKAIAPRTSSALYLPNELEYAALKAKRQEVDVNLTRIGSMESQDLAMELMPIAPGSFVMGSDRGGFRDRPAHPVTITHLFWMGRNEVTQDQYFTIMRKNPSQSKGAGLPVERVTWADANEFCNRLNERERAAKRLPKGYVYRLPTEAEWEYCCRAGSTTDYHFGNNSADIGKYGWVRSNSGRATHEVAYKKANAWGLYDMHGNVFEWVWDRYGRYGKDHETDPIGKGHRLSRSRIVRGGSWSRDVSEAKVYTRVDASPNRAYSYVGFRVVLAPQIQ